VIIQYILDLGSRGFAPRLAGVKDIVNYIFESRKAECVDKLWAHRFVQRRPKLKTHFNRIYNFQRALYKDPKLINMWFRLVENIQAKYKIVNSDFYNFDKTGFIINIITPAIIVIHTDRCSRGKAIQPGNRE